MTTLTQTSAVHLMIVLCEITYLFVIRLLCRLCAKGGWSGRAERKSQLDKC